MYFLNGQEHEITFKSTTVHTLSTIYLHLWKLIQGLEITLKEHKQYLAEIHILQIKNKKRQWVEWILAGMKSVTSRNVTLKLPEFEEMKNAPLR